MTTRQDDSPEDTLQRGSFSAESLRRVGLLIVSLLMVVSLGASGILGYLAARRDAVAVTEAQIVMLAMGVGRDLRRVVRTDPEEAVQIFNDLRDKGVTWFSVVNLRGREIFSVGTPVRDFSVYLEPPSSRSPRFPLRVEMLDGGQLAQAVIALPGPPPGGRREGGPPGDRAMLRVELVPHPAIVMVRRAHRTMWMNLVAAALLLGVAVFFWRLSRRAELERLESETVRRELEARLERDRQLKALGQMSAVLGHELRNPIASIKGHAQLLLENLPPDEPERRRVDTLVQEAAHLSALTDHILEYARTGALQLTKVFVDDLIARAVQLAGAEESARVIVAPDLPAIFLDRGKMERVLVNLIENALQAAPLSTVEISASAQGGQLVIEVMDKGPGIDPGIADRLFEPFVTGRAQGTGLGLALAQRVVADHGGLIRSGNRPEGGARIEISLPLQADNRTGRP